MDSSTFTEEAPGRLVPLITDAGRGFAPDPLPPRRENLGRSVYKLNESAAGLLGRLGGAGEYLENPYLLMRPLMRRDAIDSNAIEGTFTTARKLLLFEVFGDRDPRRSEEREVANYVEAMEHGVNAIQDRPVTLNLLREIHRILMRRVRGERKRPGEFRTTNAFIAGDASSRLEDARYVAPPLDEMERALHDFEKAIHLTYEERPYPGLVWLAMLHYQLEAIHPFLDGNGRLGRLLVPLLLCSWGDLPRRLPLLVVSPYFRRHKAEYEDRLLAVSQRAAWSDWVEFFLAAVHDQARSAWIRAKKIHGLRDAYLHRFGSGTGKIPVPAIDHLFARPVVQVKDIADAAGVTPQTGGRYVSRLVDAGVLVQEDEDRKWGRTFVATEILQILYGDEHDDLADRSTS